MDNGFHADTITLVAPYHDRKLEERLASIWQMLGARSHNKNWRLVTCVPLDQERIRWQTVWHL